MIIVPHSLAAAHLNATPKEGIMVMPDLHYHYLCVLPQNQTITETILLGGRGSAKTTSVLIKILETCHYEKHRVLIIRNTLKACTDTIFRDLDDIIKKHPFLSDVWTRTSNTFTHAITGSQIIAAGVFISGKISIDSIIGTPGVTIVVFEEIMGRRGGSMEIQEDHYRDIVLSLGRGRDTPLIQYIMTNPVSTQRWVYRAFFEEGGNSMRRSTTVVYRSTAKNNPFLNEDFLARLEALPKNSRSYRIAVLGEFANEAAETPFAYAFDEIKHVCKRDEIQRKIQQDNAIRYLIAVDFNLHNPVCLIIAVNEIYKKIYVLREVTLKKGNVSELARAAKNHILLYNSHLISVAPDMSGAAQSPNSTEPSIDAFVSALGLSKKSVLSGHLNYNGHARYAKTNLEPSEVYLMLNYVLSIWEVLISDDCHLLIGDLLETEVIASHNGVLSYDKSKTGLSHNHRNAFDAFKYGVQAVVHRHDYAKMGRTQEYAAYH